MKRFLLPLVVLLCGVAVAAPRWAPKEKEPARARVSLYRVAPGQHLAFLRYMATREELARQAGVDPIRLHAHLDGDAWDYLAIGPVTTADQDRRLDEAAAARGLKTGFAALVDFRDLIAWHTDTLVAGPSSAAELLALAER